jgi:hypothetical protein
MGEEEWVLKGKREEKVGNDPLENVAAVRRRRRRHGAVVEKKRERKLNCEN